MEKGFESWLQDQQIDPHSDPFGFRHRLNVPFMGNMFSLNVTNGNLPVVNSMVNPIPKQNLPEPHVTHGGQKNFLVFDQSNDRTTLIYSSTPMQYNFPKPQLTFDFDPKREISKFEKPIDTRFSNPFLDDGHDSVSEMREDTEELKALLYSDDDYDDDDEIDYHEDEEVQSTGHSPNLMTGFGPDNNVEEVGSSTGCWKRKNLDTEDTASSGKSGVNCSGNNSGAGIGSPDFESENFPASKRARKEKVRETINILQNLIPGGKNNGKDAMVIIDQAINYLRILKVKAQALGLDSL